MRTTALASHTPARAAASTQARAHPLRTRHHIVAPSLQIPEAATASVFAAVRQRGPIARDVIAQVTKLSIATVNRQVTSLLDAGLLRERGLCNVVVVAGGAALRQCTTEAVNVNYVARDAFDCVHFLEGLRR